MKELLCEDEGCPNYGTPHVCRNRVQSSLTVSYYSFSISIPDFSSRPLSPGENAALQIYFRNQIHKRALRLLDKKESLVLSPEDLEELKKEVLKISEEYSFDDWRLKETKSLLEEEIENLVSENQFHALSYKDLTKLALARLEAKLTATSPESLGF